jgi:hypothetical protein
MMELNKRFPATWKKVPGSGAFGTILAIDDLKGDLVGRYYFLPFTIRGEAKTGYGGAKQLAIKRKWFEKIREEAESQFPPELPVLICKFSGSRSIVKHFVALDFDAFNMLLEAHEDLHQENIRLREKWEKLAYGGHTE